MAIQDYLDRKIQAVCPIHGISFGRLNDKTTWRIDFKDEATLEQKQQAQQIINNFNYDAIAQKQDEKQRRVASFKDDPIYKFAFKQYKQNNPNATFNDFLDYLDTL